MKKLIAVSIIFGVAASVRAVPTYDDFSTYGATSTSGTLLGGNTAPSGESWNTWANVAPPLDGYPVIITNYFSGSGSSDTLAATLPSGFPGPHQTIDTSANSVWVPPGGAALGLTALGDMGAVLQFSTPVNSSPGLSVYASFFLDYPAVSTSMNGTATRSGFMGFLPNAVVSALNTTYANNAPYCPQAPTGTQTPLVINNWFGVDWRGNASTATAGILGVRDGQNVGDFATAVSAAKIYFVVIAYEWGAGAGGTDIEALWVDPAASSFAAIATPGPNKTRGSISPTALTDAAGFFFQSGSLLQSTKLPVSGIMINSLRIGTSWAYVTGGPQFTSLAPASTNVTAGQTVVLNSTAVAGGVTPAYVWLNSSGPLTLGSHFSVGPTGALTINNVQAGDADTYTLQVSTPITTVNGVSPGTAQTVVSVTTPVFISSENASAIGSSQFQLNFTGPAGSSYRIWTTTDVSLAPVANTWTPFSTNTFTSGVNTFTDTAATGAAQIYTITVP